MKNERIRVLKSIEETGYFCCKIFVLLEVHDHFTSLTLTLSVELLDQIVECLALHPRNSPVVSRALSREVELGEHLAWVEGARVQASRRAAVEPELAFLAAHELPAAQAEVGLQVGGGGQVVRLLDG